MTSSDDLACPKLSKGKQGESSWTSSGKGPDHKKTTAPPLIQTQPAHAAERDLEDTSTSTSYTTTLPQLGSWPLGSVSGWRTSVPNLGQDCSLLGSVSGWRVCYLLILLAGDVHKNPGPSRTQKYPCGICHRGVTWKTPGICGEGCNIWYHTRCINMDTAEYTALDDSNVEWLCRKCGLLNISPSALISFNSSSAKSTHLSSLGSPLFSSSPVRRTNKTTKHNLKIINVNCQSLRAKQESFRFLIAREHPDIILGTASWLSSTITNNECFPTYITSNRFEEHQNQKRSLL